MPKRSISKIKKKPKTSKSSDTNLKLSTKIDSEPMQSDSETQSALEFDIQDSQGNTNESALNSESGSTSQDFESNQNEDIVSTKKELTIAEKAQIEVNRQKALLIRQEKLNKRKYYERADPKPEKQKVIKHNDTNLVDTGGGFFIEENPNELTEEDSIASMHLVNDPLPLLPEDQPFCDECSKPFDNSYLFHNFDQPVCNSCRDRDDKHSLITKTDAKKNYLLNDTDIDKRTPPLKFILRKNPHDSRWGDMKLYLKLQVEKRALEVWGTEEALEEAIEKREEKRETTKQKKYLKKMKELRMNVRSSLYTKATKFHQHEYGEETYHSDEDEYSKTCQSCGHMYKYDKM